VWLLIAGLPFAFLSRRWWSWAALAGVIALGWHSQGGAYFSPYNRIDVQREGKDYSLAVNRDIHQDMHDNSDATVLDPAAPAEQGRSLRYRRPV
jgi:hypothetical protein